MRLTCLFTHMCALSTSLHSPSPCAIYFPLFSLFLAHISLMRSTTSSTTLLFSHAIFSSHVPYSLKIRAHFSPITPLPCAYLPLLTHTCIVGLSLISCALPLSFIPRCHAPHLPFYPHVCPLVFIGKCALIHLFIGVGSSLFEVVFLEQPYVLSLSLSLSLSL
jgi:hypothetical protein